MTDLKDQNRLTGRVRRFAQVGGAVGGLAVKLAGERFLGLDLDRGKHAAELTAAIGGIKGPLMKVVQILSTIPDGLPPEYVAELQQLQSNAPPMGWLFVKRRMATELGAGWASRFRRFEPEAAAAASLGQVHRAETADGRRVAAKLQYPDMASAVEADLQQLKVVIGLYARYDKSIDASLIFQELSERLREELDYTREARSARLYSAMLANEPAVAVPMVHADLSTPRLLVLEWRDGRRLLDFKSASQEDRNAIAQAMFRAWYVPFYHYGVIHGDPHLGNYTVREDLGVNLLDFGCIRIFPPSFVEGVIELYHALKENDDERAVHAYGIWGFQDRRKALIDVLNIWARFVYAPLMVDRVQKIQEEPSGQYGAAVAAKVHAELRRVGGVRPPREFVLMDRAAIGLGSVFLHLQAELNWYRLFHDLVDGFSTPALAARQSAALTAAGFVDGA